MENESYYRFENQTQGDGRQTAPPEMNASQQPDAPEGAPPQAFLPEGMTPPKKKRGGGRFWMGLAVGLVVATMVCVLLFLAFFSTTQAGHRRLLSLTQAESEALVDDSVIEKVDLINDTIDAYYYKDDVDIESRRNGIYNGLVDSLGDIYSVYYTAEEVEALTQQTQGVYYGIGAYVSLHQELQRAYISGIIPNSPAEEAQLKENDVIWEVDGVSTEGMQTDEVASMIRGPEGTQVVVTIRHGGKEPSVDYTLTRRKVESQTVEYEMLEDGVGYLMIREFDSVTYEQFLNAYEELKAQGLQGLVLDLRSNPGGNLDTVCYIAEQLLPKGEIVYTIDKNGHRESYESNGKNEIQIPLAVLVNGNSASASEILAGAIKDYQKGTLVGTTTFGKGIVQRLFFFDDGTGMKVTVSDYYTPNGNNIHGVGIEPDVVVEFDEEAYEKDETDNQLEKAKEIVLDALK